MERKLSNAFPGDDNQQSTVKGDKKLGPRYFFTGSGDNSVKQFKINTCKKVHHYKGIHESFICAIALTSDGKYLFTAS